MSEMRDIPFGRPWIGEEERRAVLDVLAGPILAHGPQGKAFEAEFSTFLGGGAHCVAVSSCMAALHLAFLDLGVGPGDDVLVPAQTHTATVHAVEWTGARPVFVDCDPATGNMTPEGVAAAVTPRTKAVAVVHFVGIPCDMPRIMEVAGAHGLRVVEDCALAVGARLDGRHVGLFGDAGCFSFYPVKHITTGEGGMFVTRHKDVADRTARRRAFGVDRSHAERALPGMYDVPSLGLNYRMSELQAAIGRCQIVRAPEILVRRRRHFEQLAAALRGVRGLRVLDGAGNSWYCLSVVLEGVRAARRDEIIGKLKEAGIGTSIYYPAPVPRMTYYREKYGCPAEHYREAARLSDCSIALPVGPHLSEEDVAYMSSTFLRLLGV